MIKNLLSIFVLVLALVSHNELVQAQDGDVEINKTYTCRIAGTVYSLVKKGTVLTAELATAEVAKLAKSLKKLKANLKNAKASGDSKLIKKAKNKLNTAKDLKAQVEACLDGELSNTPTPTPVATIAFPLQARGGTYTGTWNNNSASSTGPITIVLSITDGVGYSLNMDLGGNVFGNADPAAEEFTGTFTGSPPYIFNYTSPLFGSNVVVTVDANGDFQLDAPAPTMGITNYSLSIDFNDSTQSASGIFTLSFFGTTLNGTATLTKQP